MKLISIKDFYAKWKLMRKFLKFSFVSFKPFQTFKIGAMTTFSRKKPLIRIPSSKTHLQHKGAKGLHGHWSRRHK